MNPGMNHTRAPARNLSSADGPSGPALERVVVINDDSVESGGAAGIALASIRQLCARAIPVTMLTGDAGANADLAHLGVDVVSLGGRHILEGNRASAAFRGLYSARTAELLGRWIEANDTPGTVYHLHNWHKVLSAAAFVPLRKVASRLVLSAHDYFLTCPNGGYFHYPRGEICNRTPLGAACLLASCDKRHYGHKLWRVARGAVRQRVFNLADTEATVLAVHEGMRPLLERGGVRPDAIGLLRNPVSPWRSARVSAEGNKTFLFVGRLEEDKGVRILALAARRAGVPLRIIGTGPLAETLRRDFPEIEMCGWRTKAEIAELARDARALVMPSRWRETFGLVALEAAMSGIPVIGSRAALITEDLLRLGIGIGCEPEVDSLAYALSTISSDNRAVATMSQKGFTTARLLAPTPADWCNGLIALYRRKLSAGYSGEALIKRMPRQGGEHHARVRPLPGSAAKVAGS
jgi:glycosyltransferase involved in cell wall biosynthesis